MEAQRGANARGAGRGGDGVSAPPFTVVVVLHDSARELGLLLGSIDEHLAARPQVVVVDSASADDGGERARTWGAEVVSIPENRGFGAASNAGVARARAEVCVLLNPDVELLDGGIGRLAELARARDALIAPRIVRPDGRIERSAHAEPGRAAALVPAVLPPALLPERARLAAEPWRSERPRPVGWAVAACLAARTSTLRRLGPFDPSAFLFYEDLDLCVRARATRVPTVLHPEVAVRHLGGHATRPFYAGEPHELLARRRRAVVGARLGPRALALDDLAQGLTFATRAGTRRFLRRDARRERAQLAGLRAARRSGPG